MTPTVGHNAGWYDRIVMEQGFWSKFGLRKSPHTQYGLPAPGELTVIRSYTGPFAFLAPDHEWPQWPEVFWLEEEGYLDSSKPCTLRALSKAISARYQDDLHLLSDLTSHTERARDELDAAIPEDRDATPEEEARQAVACARLARLESIDPQFADLTKAQRNHRILYEALHALHGQSRDTWLRFLCTAPATFSDRRYPRLNTTLEALRQDLALAMPTEHRWTPHQGADTLHWSRAASPDLRNDLGTVAILYTEQHAKLVMPETTDEELALYGATDVAANAAAFPNLTSVVQGHSPDWKTSPVDLGKIWPDMPKERQRWGYLRWDHELQSRCNDFHRLGFKIDQGAARRHHAKLTKARDRWTVELQRLAMQTPAANGKPFLDPDRVRTLQKGGRVSKLDQGLIWLQGPKKGRPLLNPNSQNDLRDLLFDPDGGMFLQPPDEVSYDDVWTEGDDRSTKDLILRAHLAQLDNPDQGAHSAVNLPRIPDGWTPGSLDRAYADILYAIRRAKRPGTLLSRFVRPVIEAAYTFDQPWPMGRIEKAGRMEDPRIVVWRDGRFRWVQSAHTTKVGRTSAGGRPARVNVQTIKSSLRDMMTADLALNHVLVGCDADQIHLRNIANHSGLEGCEPVQSLVDDFLQGRDPHATFATMPFGDAFLAADGWKRKAAPQRAALAKIAGYTGPFGSLADDWTGEAYMMRNLGKILRYTGAYGAFPTTIWLTMTRAEDKFGELINRYLLLSEVEGLHAEWMRNEPQWKQWWAREMAKFERDGYLKSFLSGRMAFFKDGAEASVNEIYNFRTLALERDIMNPILSEIAREFPVGFDGPATGLVADIHDQAIVECGRGRRRVTVSNGRYGRIASSTDMPARVAGKMGEIFNVVVPGWPVPYTGTPTQGTTWAEL